jgi:hypothetical protein
MKNERQNDQWAGSVGSLEELPDGFHFNPQKLWNELEQQLPATAKKSRFFYYAAASVLIIAAAAFFISQGYQSEQSVLVVAPPAAKPTQQLILKDRQPLVGVKKAAEKQQVDIAPTKHKPLQVISREEIAATVPAETRELLPDMQMPSQAGPLILESKPAVKKTMVVATAKPAPKLKVIHLNELGIGPKMEPLDKPSWKQIALQQQAEQEEMAPAKENIKQVLYFKTPPRTSTSTTITDNH